jgi:hypothetical protein
LSFRLLLSLWAAIVLLACGSRTELDLFDSSGPAGATPHGDDADASASPPDAASCARCADSGVTQNDATLPDAAITDASDESVGTFVPFSACLGDGSTLVVVDNVDTFFNTNIHQFEWVAWHQNPSYIDVELDDLPLYDQWGLVFATPVDGGPLIPGTYNDAVFPPQAGLPEITIGGDAVGCDNTLGAFQIYALDLDDAGAVQTFGATFNQACIGATGGALTLSGCVYVTK